MKNKAAQWGTVIDDDIAKYIAENVTSNVRQLEGTMNKILAYRDLIGREMDADAAHRAVEDFMKKNAKRRATLASTKRSSRARLEAARPSTPVRPRCTSCAA